MQPLDLCASWELLARAGLCSCGAMPSAYFATKCPAEADCSPQAWKRAACWGYTEGKCRARVVDHLTKSRCHLMNSYDARTLAASADMEVNAFEEEPMQHASKRVRLLPPSGLLPANAAKEIAAIVADVIKSTLMEVKDELAVHRAAANASKSHVQFAPHIPLAQPDSGHFFCVNGNTVETVCTALDRSQVAAVHARRLCRAAASVFETEAKTISDAKVTIMEVFRI